VQLTCDSLYFQESLKNAEDVSHSHKSDLREVYDEYLLTKKILLDAKVKTGLLEENVKSISGDNLTMKEKIAILEEKVKSMSGAYLAMEYKMYQMQLNNSRTRPADFDPSYLFRPDTSEDRFFPVSGVVKNPSRMHWFIEHSGSVPLTSTMFHPKVCSMISVNCDGGYFSYVILPGCTMTIMSRFLNSVDTVASYKIVDVKTGFEKDTKTFRAIAAGVVKKQAIFETLPWHDSPKGAFPLFKMFIGYAASRAEA
jgi:hypothetical protein